MPWLGKENYSLLSKNETVQDVLKNFANIYNTPVFVSGKIEGNVNGHFMDLPPQAFLEKMADVHSINWYYDGNVLYFYRNDEIENKLLQLKHLKPSKLKRNLHTLGIWDHQYNWKELPDSGVIYLSGPPRMVEIISETAVLMDLREKEQTEATYSVRMFPLKYASSYDRTVTFRQESMDVPGVASMLKRLINNTTQSQPTPNITASGIEKLKGKGLNKPTDENTLIPIGNPGDNAKIEADIRSNSVVIYDLNSRMAIYEELINQLDTPVDQIEINVSIINIRTSKVEDLGISWRSSSKGEGVIGFGDLPNGSEPDGSGIGLSIGPDVSFSSVASSATNNLFARLNMLTEQGEAQVISRPSVVSTDNMEAILDNSYTFHVRVAGQEEVDLFPISVGSVLRVTPHVIKNTDSNSIHLEINIEDGQQTQETVDNIPTIQNSTISTRAIIKENESLLIGGYHFDTIVSSESRVPFLSSIPLFGGLFKTTHDENSRMARLFLITPKLINSNSNSDAKEIENLSLSQPLSISSLVKEANCHDLLHLKDTNEPGVIIPSECKPSDHHNNEKAY